MEENKVRQIEEIEALSSIYGDDLDIEDDENYSVQMSEGGVVAVLYIKLEDGYPSEGPPVYTLSSPSISTLQRRSLCNELERVYLDNIGECVVFLWIEEIRTFLQSIPSSDDSDSTPAGDKSSQSEESSSICDKLSSLEVVECPDIITGQCFEDRKSVFQGHVAVVTSVIEVKAVLRKLYENKKIANATHNMYAYRIYVDQRKAWLQDCDDDGETAAGGRMLHLEIMEAKNLIIVVSRWYGGTHLGPDRFKHINNSARQVLEQSGLITTQDKSKKKKK